MISKVRYLSPHKWDLLLKTFPDKLPTDTHMGDYEKQLLKAILSMVALILGQIIDLLIKDALEKWYSIKLWSKENNKDPKLFGIEEEEKECEKTFKEVALEFLEDVFKPKNKERTYQDRANKINQMLKFIGDEKLISDLEIEKDGRKYISNMLKTLFHDSPVQLTRCRQLLSQIFNYAEDETYIRPNQNPVFKKFQWETGNQRKISDKTFAILFLSSIVKSTPSVCAPSLNVVSNI